MDSYIPLIGGDARAFFVFATATGMGLRIVQCHRDQIDLNINRDYGNGNVGDPIYTIDTTTGVSVGAYPGAGGESYVEIDPINQRSFLQEAAGKLRFVNGSIAYKQAFDAFATSAAVGTGKIRINNLPIGTQATIIGTVDTKPLSLTINDGYLELASPITQTYKIVLSHYARLTTEFILAFA